MSNQSYSLSYKLSEMAQTHPNDLISNALARLSNKIDKYGDTFYTNLNETEKQLLKYYLSRS